MLDRHVRRSGKDYAQALTNLLPIGLAWPRDPDGVQFKVISGLAYFWGSTGVDADSDLEAPHQLVDGRAADLLERESDPRATIELLPDWERAWGLPDLCFAEPVTIADRQRILVIRMTMLGGQSRQFFTDLAQFLGYTIRIREYAPWMFGVSEFGITDDGTGYTRWEIGPPEIRFYWTIFVDRVRLTWWRFGSAEFGIDPHLRIGLATDLECMIRRWKPAHTEILFDYTSLIFKTAILKGCGQMIANTRQVTASHGTLAGAGGAFISYRDLARKVDVSLGGAGNLFADVRMTRQYGMAIFAGYGGGAARIGVVGQVSGAMVGAGGFSVFAVKII